jgi:phospholipase/lecithinase/hemolysin
VEPVFWGKEEMIMRDNESNFSSGARWISLAFAVLILAAPGWAVAGGSKGGLVIFGTSLSDPGNAFALRGGNNTPPDYSVDPFLVPDRPYAKGGHHFSNGPTWIEQYARPRGLASNAKPAFRSSSAKAANYAVGGARARPEGPANLSEQVYVFLQQVNSYPPPDALYVIEMGGNDVRDALQELFIGDPIKIPGIISGAITGITTNIETLTELGARKFLVWYVPNVGLTPAIRGLGDLAVIFATNISTNFNYGLKQALDLLESALSTTYPDLVIVRFDSFTTLNAIVANQADFGLTQVEAACITPSVPPFACRNPDEYLFWDGIHPTRAAHSIIAHEVAALPLP